MSQEVTNTPMGGNMYQTQRTGRFKGSMITNIALAVEASQLYEEITGAPLAAWIASAGMAPGSFGWSQWVDSLEELSQRNEKIIASADWANLEERAGDIALEWGEDQIAQTLVVPETRGAAAPVGSRVLQSLVRSTQDADPTEALQWAIKMTEVGARVSGASTGLTQFGFGSEWGTLCFTNLYPDSAALDAGVAKTSADPEYVSVFMEGRKYVDISTMRRLLLVKIA